MSVPLSSVTVWYQDNERTGIVQQERDRSVPDDTTVPNNKKMNSGDSGSSGSDKPLTLVELQLELAGSNKLLLEEKERSKQLKRSKLFLLKEKERL